MGNPYQTAMVRHWDCITLFIIVLTCEHFNGVILRIKIKIDKSQKYLLKYTNNYKVYALNQIAIFSIAVIFNFFYMVLNMLSVCVTVFILSMHFTEPTPEVPAWLAKLTLRPKMEVEPCDGLQVQKETTRDENQTCQTNARCSQREETKDNRISVPHEVVAGPKANGNADEAIEKWRKVGKVLNRFFYYLFLSTFTLTTVVFTIIWFSR